MYFLHVYKIMMQSPIREADKDLVDQEVYFSWTAVEIEAASFYETLANIYQPSYPQIPEQMRLYQYRCVSLKSWKMLQVLRSSEVLLPC
jgi:hypothetical protein